VGMGRGAADYLKQCEEDRREMFAFGNAEGRRQRMEQAGRDTQEAYERHERFKHNWAGEKDAEECLKNVNRREEIVSHTAILLVVYNV